MPHCRIICALLFIIILLYGCATRSAMLPAREQVGESATPADAGVRHSGVPVAGVLACQGGYLRRLGVFWFGVFRLTQPAHQPRVEHRKFGCGNIAAIA
jgi:hypothetical protein